MTTFRAAIEARDMDAVEAMLADDVAFRSPVAFMPYPARGDHERDPVIERAAIARTREH